MREDEIKVLRIGNITTVAELLRQIGAKENWSGNRTIVTFDWSNDFYQKQDILIRLTKAMNSSKFTVHINNSQPSREVYETHIGNDYEQTYAALKALGFLPCTKVDALRYDFEYHDLSIHLNKFPAIPAFMEINGSAYSGIPITSLLSDLNISSSLICTFGTEAIHKKYYGIDYFEAYHI